jgi:hypothetical protein
MSLATEARGLGPAGQGTVGGGEIREQLVELVRHHGAVGREKGTMHHH